MKEFGKELILDLHNCDITFFTRHYIKMYFIGLCDLIDMERCKLCWWDYKGYPEEYKKAPDHLKGISAIQFIKTSNITIHSLDVLGNAYINIFSCKNFNATQAKLYTKRFFKGKIVTSQTIRRK